MKPKLTILVSLCVTFFAAADLRADTGGGDDACLAWVVGTCDSYNIGATCISWHCSDIDATSSENDTHTMCKISCKAA